LAWKLGAETVVVQREIESIAVLYDRELNGGRRAVVWIGDLRGESFEEGRGLNRGGTAVMCLPP
jgi:hypothetical protein